MDLGVLAETDALEKRVALTPSVAAKLIGSDATRVCNSAYVILVLVSVMGLS